MADPGFPNGGGQGRGAPGAEVLATTALDLAEGAEVKRRRREDRGAEGVGCGEGVPPSLPGKGSGEGAVPPPQNFFLILALNMVSLGAFWMVFFYSSATCFRRKTGVQPQYAYKSRDGK